LALRWFRDQFYNASRGQAQTIPTGDYEDVYRQMIEMAAQVEPGSEWLFFSPHLGGRICPASPEMRGAWIGVSW